MSRFSDYRRLLDSRAVSAPELLEETFAVIRREDPGIRAYGSLREELAYAEAGRAQALLDAGRGNALTGLPAALKDNFCIKDETTTCGSAILSDYLPGYDADIVRTLKDSCAPIAGKTKMDEFAMGSSGQRDFRGPVHNPLDPSLVPGGSSGGSAAAVASGQCFWSLGSDTGGSVVLPAAFCGVTGFAPSWGTLSRYGLIAFASGYDQPGILAETPGDVASIMGCLTAGDAMDATLHPGRCTGYTPEPLDAPATLGLPEEIWKLLEGSGLEEDYEATLSRLEHGGWKIRRVSVPGIEKAVALYQVITSCQAYSNLARYDGVRYGLRGSGPFAMAAEEARSSGFGPEVKRRILIGASLLGKETSGIPYYSRALSEAEKLGKAFDEALRSCDFLAMPASLTAPFAPDAFRDHPGRAHGSDICAVGCDLTRLPTLSVPFPASAFPRLGLLLSTRRFQDGRLLAAGERIYREVNA